MYIPQTDFQILTTSHVKHFNDHEYICNCGRGRDIYFASSIVHLDFQRNTFYQFFKEIKRVSNSTHPELCYSDPFSIILASDKRLPHQAKNPTQWLTQGANWSLFHELTAHSSSNCNANDTS